MNYKYSRINLKFPSIKLLFLIILHIALFIPLSSSADIQLSLQPTPIIVGEPASLSLNSTDGKAHIDKLPKIKDLTWNIDYNKYSSNIITINGKRFEKTVYEFTVSKPGVIKLPSMEIISNNDTVYTQEKKIRIVKGPLANLESQLYIKIDNDFEKYIYIGQEVPLKIDLYKADSLSATPQEYPKIKMDNVVFDDFSNVNRENDRFAPYPYSTPKRFQKDGINFTKTTFFTAFRALGSGPLEGTISLLCSIKIPSRGRLQSGRHSSLFGDNFFNNDSFFSGSIFDRGGESVSKLLTINIPKLNIMPLPSPPLDAIFLGLIGNWTVKTNLSSDNIKEGEPLTLSINIIGHGTLETLSAPELSIPGFMVYSPEIKKDEQSMALVGNTTNANINYVLIPIDSGRSNINISFATFNPQIGTYTTSKINKSIDILPDSHASKSVIYGNMPAAKTAKISQKIKQKISNAILYLKQNVGKDVLIPLWLNHIVLIALLILLGPLLWIFIELLYFKKNRIDNNITLQRKGSAIKRKKGVIKAITKATSNSLADTIQKEAVPYINDLKGYPPGTTADELSNKLNDKKLAEYIKKANALSYMPSLDKNSSNLKNNLLKALKRLSVLVIICSVSLSITNKVLADSPLKAGGIYQLMTSYNKADFNKSEKICIENIHFSTPNSDWIYNLGNCYYQNGNLADALVCYERAFRLAPRDSDILENLNFVRRKLFLPEIYQTQTPVELLKSVRDSFRPDEWMVIFAMAWFFLFLALILRRFTQAKIWVTTLSIAFAITICSTIAVLSEKEDMYNPNIALVVERNLNIYSLPSADSSKTSTILNPGDQVRIVEKLNHWLRIRKGKSEGWVKQNSITIIWPY